MKVTLIKKASYEFDGSKYTPIPHATFDALTGLDKKKDDSEETEGTEPRIAMFNTMMDYAKNVSTYDDVDKDAPVFVSEKGQVFVFLGEGYKTFSEDGTTDTEENKGE